MTEPLTPQDCKSPEPGMVQKRDEQDSSSSEMNTIHFAKPINRNVCADCRRQMNQAGDRREEIQPLESQIQRATVPPLKAQVLDR